MFIEANEKAETLVEATLEFERSLGVQTFGEAAFKKGEGSLFKKGEDGQYILTIPLGTVFVLKRCFISNRRKVVDHEPIQLEMHHTSLKKISTYSTKLPKVVITELEFIRLLRQIPINYIEK